MASITLQCALFNLNFAVISGKAGSEEYASAIKTAVLPTIYALQTALNKSLLLEIEKGNKYFALDTTELIKGDILKRYQAYRLGLDSNFLQIDEVRYKEDLKPLNFNYIKLGLDSVLLDPTSNTIYTANTNQTAKLGEAKANIGLTTGENRTITENRYSAKQPRDKDGKFGDCGGSTSDGNNSDGCVDKSAESGIIKMDKSLSAKAFTDRVLLPDGSKGRVKENFTITKVVAFAGKGTQKPVKVAPHLAKQYNNNESDWIKLRGDGYVECPDGKVRHAELHWFESESTGRVKMKVKRWFDEN